MYKETDYPNPEALNADFFKDRETYEKHIKSFNKKVEAGEYLPGFIVSGDNAGGTSYFVITKKQAEEKSKDGKVTPSSTKAEISRLKERQTRNKELDEEKILPKIYDLLDQTYYLPEEKAGKSKGRKSHEWGRPTFKNIDKALNNEELQALVIHLLNKQQSDEDFFMAIGYKETDGIGFFKHLQSRSPQSLQAYVNVLTRLSILDHFKPGKWQTYSKKKEMASLIAVTKTYKLKEVDALFAEQNENAAKRKTRVDARIKGLEATLKTSPAKAAPAKKKAAKKAVKK